MPVHTLTFPRRASPWVTESQVRDVTLAACIVIWLATPLLLAVLCGGPLNLWVRDEIPRGKARQSIGRRVDGFIAPQADHFGD
jgi:hypothetical protein